LKWERRDIAQERAKVILSKEPNISAVILGIRLGVGANTVRRWLQNGKLDAAQGM
jgi:hypothetical protein